MRFGSSCSYIGTGTSLRWSATEASVAAPPAPLEEPADPADPADASASPPAPVDVSTAPPAPGGPPVAPLELAPLVELRPPEPAGATPTIDVSSEHATATTVETTHSAKSCLLPAN